MSRSNPKTPLRRPVEDFLAPYAEIKDEFLEEIVKSRPGDLHIIYGTMSVTGHVAASILALRKAIR